jgi:hypothetical protein
VVRISETVVVDCLLNFRNMSSSATHVAADRPDPREFSLISGRNSDFGGRIRAEKSLACFQRGIQPIDLVLLQPLRREVRVVFSLSFGVV